MSIEFGSCFNCEVGFWVDIFPVHTFDYNVDGYVPNVCNNCGITRDSYVAVIEMRRSFRKTISNRKLKKILWNLCSEDDMQMHRSSIYQEIKDNKYIVTISDLVDELISCFSEVKSFFERDFVEKIIIDCINS